MRRELPAGLISPRQLEIWRMTATGMLCKEIAWELGIGWKTVEKHRYELYRRIGAKGIADLTRMAIEYGVITVTVKPLIPQRWDAGKVHYRLPDFGRYAIHRVFAVA